MNVHVTRLFLVTRQLFQISVLFIQVIDLAIIMCQTVGNEQVLRIELHIVSGDLVKAFLGNCYMRGLAFYNKFG